MSKKKTLLKKFFTDWGAGAQKRHPTDAIVHKMSLNLSPVMLSANGVILSKNRIIVKIKECYDY
jgi:hypothetical protein